MNHNKYQKNNIVALTYWIDLPSKTREADVKA